MSSTDTTAGMPPPRKSTTPPQDKTQEIPRDKPQGPFPPRKQAVIDFMGVPCIPLGILATIDQHGKPETEVSPWTLDVLTITQYAEPIADAVVMVADQYPQLGMMLDKLGAVTPFGAILGALMGLGLQLAENHGALPAGMADNAPGITPRQDFARSVYAQAMARQNGNGQG